MCKHSYVKAINICVVLFLSACSPSSNTANLYKSEHPIGVSITTPSQLSADLKGTVSATLTQDGQPLTHPTFVHFEIWNQEGTVTFAMEEAANGGNGMFQLTKPFPQQGLYFVKVHASSNGAIIMPTKQFVIGELTEGDKKFLKNSEKHTSSMPEGHH